MDQFEKVESEKSALYRHLDDNFQVTALPEIAKLSEDFSRILCVYVSEAVSKNAKLIFTNATEGKFGPGKIRIGGNDFRIEYASSLNNETDVLQFIITEHGPRQSGSVPTVKACATHLPPRSQFNELCITYDGRINVNEQLLLNLCSSLLAAGYQWISDKISYIIRIETSKIATGLYDYMRAMVAQNPDLLQGFLFTCLIDDSDFVIIDEQSTQGALDLATGSVGKYQRSKESMVLQMMSDIVKFDDSVVHDACESDERYLVVDIFNGLKYYKSDSALNEALTAVWGREVICQPVSRDKKLRLVAFYPTSKVDELEPILTAHSERLREIANNQRQYIADHLNLLQKYASITTGPDVSPDRQKRLEGWANIGGTFLGTFLGKFSKSIQS